jgi:hypothetical protein
MRNEFLWRTEIKGDKIMKTIAFALLCCASLLAQNDGRVVGKPYSATEVIRSQQTLPNGSHIDRTVTNLVWQDDQGRLRTEMRDDRQKAMIQDNVAKVVYALDLKQKTVRKIDLRGPAAEALQKIAGDVSPVDEARAAEQANASARVGTARLIEDLGSQFINGVSALGVRVTTTIPVGAIGNDQELKSVTERWYSNDIHALVRTVTRDARSGVNTLELTSIVRAAPDPALFQIPAGFSFVANDGAPVSKPEE